MSVLPIRPTVATEEAVHGGAGSEFVLGTAEAVATVELGHNATASKGVIAGKLDQLRRRRFRGAMLSNVPLHGRPCGWNLR